MALRAGLTVPDVSVIVAVYNTMPYLTECLTSLVGQSIGLDRIEVIAVDDGSTDGSGKELDRFADSHPGIVHVIHQSNSGGPAAPSNRALEQARGRYVYFVGADDYLGEEALERLVEAADKYDSDVVIGKMVGINQRYIHHAMFKSTEHEIGFNNSALPWSLGNCKLFRRNLIERYELRFPEDMRVGSDQPLTIEACYRARRISVLADYDYYFAVRRADISNISLQTRYPALLECAEKLIRFTVGLMPPGPDRDSVLVRHFTWEVGKIVGRDFPGLDPPLQERLCAGISRIADDFLTDAILARIDVTCRVRLSLARRGAVDEHATAIRLDTAGHGPPIVVDGDRAYLGYPGFRNNRLALSDDLFAVNGDLASRMAKGTETLSLGWGRGIDGRTDLTVAARTALVGPAALDAATTRIVVVPVAGRRVPGPRRRPQDQQVPKPVSQVVREETEEGEGVAISARVPVRTLVAGQGSRARRLSVRLDVDVAGTTYEIPIAAHGSVSRTRCWHRGRPYRVAVVADENGRSMITVVPTRPVGLITRRLRRLVARSGEKQS